MYLKTIQKTYAHLGNLLSSANFENRKKEIVFQAAWHETMGKSPYCLNIQHCVEFSALYFTQKAKSASKTCEDIAKGEFIELHYILKGLAAPAHKESHSVQINMLKAPSLLYFFQGEICDILVSLRSSRLAAEEQQCPLLANEIENIQKSPRQLVRKQSY